MFFVKISKLGLKLVARGGVHEGRHLRERDLLSKREREAVPGCYLVPGFHRLRPDDHNCMPVTCPRHPDSNDCTLECWLPSRLLVQLRAWPDMPVVSRDRVLDIAVPQEHTRVRYLLRYYARILGVKRRVDRGCD